jgi:hypothetical protein
MSKDREPKVLAVLLDAIGDEPLAGSGFEEEDPEENFSMTEEAATE